MLINVILFKLTHQLYFIILLYLFFTIKLADFFSIFKQLHFYLCVRLYALWFCESLSLYIYILVWRAYTSIALCRLLSVACDVINLLFINGSIHNYTPIKIKLLMLCNNKNKRMLFFSEQICHVKIANIYVLCYICYVYLLTQQKIYIYIYILWQRRTYW